CSRREGRLALVVAVDADDRPAGQRARARVGLLEAVEQVAEQRDGPHARLPAVLQRPPQRPVRAVDVREHADDPAQLDPPHHAAPRAPLPSRMGAPRSRASISRAWRSVSGGTPSATSLSVSTKTPPSPTAIAGPKLASRVMPRISSRPTEPPVTISCTSTPRIA